MKLPRNKRRGERAMIALYIVLGVLLLLAALLSLPLYFIFPMKRASASDCAICF